MRVDDILENIYHHVTVLASKKYRQIIREVGRIESASGILMKVRVVFVDNSFLDVYWSASGKYSLHYERRHIDGTFYRHDNAPHEKHRRLKTFPKHFHRGGENKVEESFLPDDPVKAVELFLKFVQNLIGPQK